MAGSRPTSIALLASAVPRPTLREVLSNSAPPPWTLGAFMAYLSQNHCLETLEFTMEADRYRDTYFSVNEHQSLPTKAMIEHVSLSWQKLINAYILPCSPREVNLPAPVRDHLLALPTVVPPHPSELDDAVTIVYELMNDSVLLPFLESASPSHMEHDLDAAMSDAGGKVPRPAMPSSKDSVSSAEDSGRSPRHSLLPAALGWRLDGHARSKSASSELPESELMTDDSGGSTPPAGGEPLTPPTTPPTSEWSFTSPTGNIQKAITLHNNGWKRMSARLGLGKKSKSGKRAHATSAPPPLDSTMSEGSGSSNISPTSSSSTSNPL